MFGYGKTAQLKEEIVVLRRYIELLQEENIKLKKPKRRKKRKLLQNHSTGYHKVTPEEANEMLALYDQGLCQTEIANFTGRSGSCVSRHLSKKIEERENDRKQVGSLFEGQDWSSEKEESSSKTGGEINNG